jgi:hypothetical protein
MRRIGTAHQLDHMAIARVSTTLPVAHVWKVFLYYWVYQNLLRLWFKYLIRRNMFILWIPYIFNVFKTLNDVVFEMKGMMCTRAINRITRPLSISSSQLPKDNKYSPYLHIYSRSVLSKLIKFKKDDCTSSSIRICQKIPKVYNTYNSVRLLGWPIKGTKINSAEWTRCRPSYRMPLKSVAWFGRCCW